MTALDKAQAIAVVGCLLIALVIGGCALLIWWIERRAKKELDELHDSLGRRDHPRRSMSKDEYIDWHKDGHA